MKRWFFKALGYGLILMAIGLALSRAPDRDPQTLVARWAPAPSDFIEVKGQTVHLRDVGPRDDPTPVVLLHGTGSSLHTWEGWVSGLKETRRVITLDLPGFGLTGPYTGSYAPQDYSADTTARFVLDVLDHLRVARAVVGGNSLGGEVAWRMAVLAPQRVDRLVLVAPAGTAFTPERIPVGLLMARIPVINRLGEHVLPRAAIDASVRGVYGDPGKVTPELIDRYFEFRRRRRPDQWCAPAHLAAVGRPGPPDTPSHAPGVPASDRRQPGCAL